MVRVTVNIRDTKGTDIPAAAIEAYLAQLVAEMMGTSVNRITSHGAMKPNINNMKY